MPTSTWTAAAPDRGLPLALGLLGVSNWVANRRLTHRGYVPWNLGVAGLLLVLARRVGCDAEDVGLDPAHLAAGIGDGGRAAAAVALSYGLLLATPGGRAAFADDRVTSLSPGAVAWQTVVRIPLGTVLLEEVAFRGVLPALLARTGRSQRVADVVPAVLFGLWHVLPSRDLHQQNEGMRRVVGPTGAAGSTVAAVVTTTVAGLVMQRLRRRSGHLAAPALIHLSTNVLGVAGGRLVARERSAAGRRLVARERLTAGARLAACGRARWRGRR